jgi:hypothetical protein
VHALGQGAVSREQGATGGWGGGSAVDLVAHWAMTVTCSTGHNSDTRKAPIHPSRAGRALRQGPFRIPSRGECRGRYLANVDQHICTSAKRTRPFLAHTLPILWLSFGHDQPIQTTPAEDAYVAGFQASAPTGEFSAV